MDELIGWAVVAGVAYAGYKLLFGSSALSPRQIPQTSIDQFTAVFPGVTDRAARYELERNGGSVERAVERALREGGLPEPPASYFPPPPPSTATPSPGTPRPLTPQPTASSSSTIAARAPPPSLIQRMGLQSQAASQTPIKGKGKGKEEESAGEMGGWSPSASERERKLRERKERLVLEARRKLMEKERARKEAAEGGAAAADESS
ncbi:hypothetical protein JCM8097_000637 [Rhodosporidiobolus ruineniae]